MEVFLTLFSKIVPLYLLIFFGFFAGKFFKVDRESIASLLFYIIVPVVFFDVALETNIQPEYLLLPLIFFSISTILCFIYLFISKRVFKDKRANIIAFAAGTGNTGYFGLPLALLLFPEQVVGVYMLGNIGLSIYDYSIGAYVIARGNFTKWESIKKVSQLPMLYAFAIGLVLNQFGAELPKELDGLAQYMRGSYIVLGMMIIGLGLSTVKKIQLDYKFLALFLSAKFIVAPLVVSIFIALDKYLFSIFEGKDFIYQIMILLSIVPPAANSVVFATINKCHPEETATSVAIGTLIAVFYVPVMIALFF